MNCVSHRDFAIFGLSTFSMALAQRLESLGSLVTIYEPDQRKVDCLKKRSDRVFFLGITGVDEIAKINFSKYEAVIVAPHARFHENISYALRIRATGFNNIWVYAYNRSELEVLKAAGFENAFCLELDTAERLAQLLH